MSKKLIILVLILILFSGCTHTYITPKLIEIDPKTKSLPKRAIKYTITEDGNVTIKIKDAKWIVGKLNRCTKNSKKLRIANKALNSQIRSNNSTK